MLRFLVYAKYLRNFTPTNCFWFQLSSWLQLFLANPRDTHSAVTFVCILLLYAPSPLRDIVNMHIFVVSLCSTTEGEWCGAGSVTGS